MSRILLVMEDSFEFRVMRAALKECGYEVVEAIVQNHTPAADYEEIQPDLVITNLAFGKNKLAGLDVVTAVRDTVPGAKVVVCSDSADPKKVDMAVTWGACDYLLKPVPTHRLIARVKAALAMTQKPRMKRIMLVMESGEMIKPFEDILERSYKVMAKEVVGEICAEQYRQVMPDLVVTNLTLAGDMDGLYVISTIRAADPAARVMLCGRPKELTKAVQADAAGRGCCGFLTLPTDGGALLSSVERCLSQKRVPVPGADNRAIIAGQAPFVRKVLMDTLLQNGYDPLVAADTGEDCITLWRKLRPALTLVGTKLAGRLGAVDVVRAIRAEDAYAKVMLCGSQYPSEMREDAYRAGACDCIVLPVDVPRLGKAVKGHCAWTMN